MILAETGTAHDAEYSAKYAATLDDGARALALTTSRGPVVVLDFANAFSVGFGYLPAPGDYLVSMFGRTFNMNHFLPAEIILKDARVVMEPKWSLDPGGTDAFLKLYAAYLAKNFVETEGSLYWRIYRRRDDAGAAVSLSGGSIARSEEGARPGCLLPAAPSDYACIRWAEHRGWRWS